MLYLRHSSKRTKRELDKKSFISQLRVLDEQHSDKPHGNHFRVDFQF